jgi:twinkle protein
MTDILAVKQALAGRVGDVAQMLLPGGRREGHEWRAGSVDGEKGQSLGVHLVGTKAGVWADFSAGQSGDLLDLWMQVRRLTLTEALDQARSYLGMERQQPYREPRKQYTRPAKPHCTPPRNRVRDYLCEERNIPASALEAYKIGEDGSKIVFPFLLPSGELALVKVREAVDGASPKPTAADCEPVLFGWQVMPANAREVVLTEGEIDALSMFAYGFPAMSVPFGGGGKGKQNWIENEFDRLERFERIYIATDMDKVGEEAAVEIAARLGRHRCYRVKLPRKDANKCLVDGVPKEEIAACIAAAESLDPEGLRRAADFEDQVVGLFWPSHETHVGYSLPYVGLNGQILFRPGEVTLWSGASGSGKSQIISDCVPRWIREGSRVCVASFEMQPQWTLKRMVKQAGGVERPTAAFIHEILNYLDAGLLLYEKVGKSDIQALLEIFDYARAKYGCDQFVIDSLMRLGIAGDDYTGQEQAMFKIVDWAIGKNVHLHLVAHTRKAGAGQGAPEAEDVKGAMEIGANAFNILTIWRNRKIETMDETDHRPDMTEEPGVTVNVAKQRNGDFEGKVKLYFNTKTYQYFSTADNRRMARCYIDNLLTAAE